MPDFDAMATALAARFGPAVVSPPAGGYDPIRWSTPDLADGIGPLPGVYVFPASGDFVSGNGKRESGSEWLVRFYYSQSGTLDRDMAALRKWLGLLVDATKGAVQLGGLVELALVMSWRIDTLQYGGNDYTGIELGVHVETHESWLATA